MSSSVKQSISEVLLPFSLSWSATSANTNAFHNAASWSRITASGLPFYLETMSAMVSKFPFLPAIALLFTCYVYQLVLLVFPH